MPSVPLIEQITRKIKARLITITQGNGYQIVVREVVRPKRRNDYSPAEGVAVLRLATFEQGEEINNTIGLLKQRSNVWEIDYFIQTPEDDDRPLDLLQAIAIAEIERALSTDFYNDAGGAYDGLGWGAKTLSPQLIEASDASIAGVRINLEVSYRFAENDPYTAK